MQHIEKLRRGNKVPFDVRESLEEKVASFKVELAAKKILKVLGDEVGELIWAELG